MKERNARPHYESEGKLRLALLFLRLALRALAKADSLLHFAHKAFVGPDPRLECQRLECQWILDLRTKANQRFYLPLLAFAEELRGCLDLSDEEIRAGEERVSITLGPDERSLIHIRNQNLFLREAVQTLRALAFPKGHQLTLEEYMKLPPSLRHTMEQIPGHTLPRSDTARLAIERATPHQEEAP